MKKINFISVLCVLFFVGSAHAGCDYNAVYLTGPWGKARFSVEVADDDPKRAQGLMNRESLPQFSGMIFIYDNPQMVSFWMKNTLIPLDLLYFDPKGQLVDQFKNAMPGDLTPMPSSQPVQFILEINGGLLEKLSITRDTELSGGNSKAGEKSLMCR